MIPIYLLTYKRPEYLFCTLDNLTKNTVYPHKVFVGTQDRSEETKRILNIFKENRKSIDDWCYQRDKDFRKNRDRLIGKFNIKNDYFVITDDDILFEKWWLAKMVALMEKYADFGMIGCELDEVDMPDRSNPLTPRRKKNKMIWTRRNRYDNELDETESVAVPMVSRQKLYKKIGEYYRDHNYSIELKKRGYKVGLAKNVKARHLGQNIFYDYPNNYLNAGESIK